MTGTLVSLSRFSNGDPTSTTIRMSTPICSGDIDRHVLGDATVDQQSAIALDGREDAGRRQACAHRRRQVPRLHDHGIPVSRSVATALKGVGRSSKLVRLATGSVRRRSV